MTGGRLRGAVDVIRTLKAFASKFPDDVAKALYEEAKIELAEAKRRTPIHTGHLRQSGFVSQPTRGLGRKISVQVGFSAQYAVFVHEDLDVFHPVGQAKFLESTLHESAPYMAARIAKRIDLKRRPKD